MATSANSSKSTARLVLILVIPIAIVVGLIIFGSLFVYLSFGSTSSRAQKKVLVNSYPLTGGKCEYYTYDSSGKVEDTCVDASSVEKAVAMLPQAGTSTIDTDALIVIQGDAHTAVQKRSAATLDPEYSQVNVIVFDSIDSVSASSVQRSR